MISLYPIHYQSVKQKGRQFISSLILLSIEIYLLINKFTGNYCMMLQSNINQTLVSLGLSKSQIFSYNTLLSEYPINQKFHTYPIERLEEKLKLKTRQFRTHLSIFCDLGLVKKEYHTLQLEEREIGNILYLTITPPVELTFNAKFDVIEETTHERGYTTTIVRFSDIFAIDEDISFKHTWHNSRIEDNEITLLKSLESGDPVYFEAEVKLGKQGKQWLDKIKNIREA